jgi:hypothetical protein
MVVSFSVSSAASVEVNNLILNICCSIKIPAPLSAMTVSELMCSAKPSILIPLPHAIDNHQFHNAKILADNGAGILIEQQMLSILFKRLGINQAPLA